MTNREPDHVTDRERLRYLIGMSLREAARALCKERPEERDIIARHDVDTEVALLAGLEPAPGAGDVRISARLKPDGTMVAWLAVQGGELIAVDAGDIEDG